MNVGYHTIQVETRSIAFSNDLPLNDWIPLAVFALKLDFNLRFLGSMLDEFRDIFCSAQVLDQKASIRYRSQRKVYQLKLT